MLAARCKMLLPVDFLHRTSCEEGRSNADWEPIHINPLESFGLTVHSNFRLPDATIVINIVNLSRLIYQCCLPTAVSVPRLGQ